MDNVELAIRMTADASDAAAAMDDVGDAAGRMASDVDDATRKCDDAGDRMGAVGEHADEMASKSSQAAGGIGDLAGALESTGLIGEGTAMAMETASAAIMGVTGASDLLNLVTESNIVIQAKQRISTVATAVATRTQAAATKAAAIAQRVMNAAMRANPIGLVITAILLLVAGFVLAYKKSETFRRIVNAVMAAVRAYITAVIKVITTVVGWVRDKLPAAWTYMKGKAVAVWQAVRNFVAAAIDRVVAVVTTMRDRVAAVWQAVKDKAGAAWSWVRDQVTTVVGRIRDTVDRIKDTVANVADAIRDKLGAAWDWVLDKIQPVIDAIQKVGDIGSHIPGLGKIFGRTETTPASLTTSPVGRLAGAGDTVHIHMPLLARLDDSSTGQLVRTLDDYYRRRGQRVAVVAG